MDNSPQAKNQSVDTLSKRKDYDKMKVFKIRKTLMVQVARSSPQHLLCEAEHARGVEAGGGELPDNWKLLLPSHRNCPPGGGKNTHSQSHLIPNLKGIIRCRKDLRPVFFGVVCAPV